MKHDKIVNRDKIFFIVIDVIDVIENFVAKLQNKYEINTMEQVELSISSAHESRLSETE